MASPVTSAEFRKVLEEGLRDVTEKRFAPIESKKDKFYRVMTTERYAEEFYSLSGVGDIPEFAGKIEYLPMYPGYSVRIEPTEFAGGIMFERKVLDDKRYDVLSDRAGYLADSAARVYEKNAALPIINATSTSYTFMTVYEEGVALASNSHTTKSGTSTSTGFDNLGTSALSKTSIAATRLAMRQFRDDISERFDMDDSFALIVPDTLEEAAYEIVKTPKGYDTSAQDVNFQYGKYEIIVLPRWDDYDTNNWAMVNKNLMKKYLIWLDRIKPEPKNTWDFDTYILKHAIYFRFGCGWTDWRWMYFQNVT